MCGAIPPLPQYAFMAWCLVEKITGRTLPVYKLASVIKGNYYLST
jgi:hypothetical protein